jgi:hypothetical protein
MRNPVKGAVLAGGLVAVIFVSGCFHADSKTEARRPPSPLCIAESNEAKPALAVQ